MTLRKLLLGFNLSLLLILFLSLALPFVLLGSDAPEYLYHNLYGLAIMLVSFAGINTYFVYNWSLFQALETGDWYSLLHVLRSKIFQEQCYSKKYIFYYIEAAIQLNNLELLCELSHDLQVRAGILEKLQFLHEGKRIGLLRLGLLRLRFLHSGSQWKLYRQGRVAQKRLCEFALELGLPHLIDDPGHGSEIYFGGLRDFTSLRQHCYLHKYKWAELFYAISLLVQGKQQYAARLLEQLLLARENGEASGKRRDRKKLAMRATWQESPCAERGGLRGRVLGKLSGSYISAISGKIFNILQQIKLRKRLREDGLLQLVSIQLLEDIQENSAPSAEDSETDLGVDCGELLVIDQQLIDMRRAEIQQIYDSPRHWSSYLLKEQSQNIATTMIQQLINAAYEQQLQPAHQAHLTGVGSAAARGKSPKSQLGVYQR